MDRERETDWVRLFNQSDWEDKKYSGVVCVQLYSAKTKKKQFLYLNCLELYQLFFCEDRAKVLKNFKFFQATLTLWSHVSDFTEVSKYLPSSLSFKPGESQDMRGNIKLGDRECFYQVKNMLIFLFYSQMSPQMFQRFYNIPLLQ